MLNKPRLGNQQGLRNHLRLRDYGWETAALIIYAISLVFTLLNHEPWFDEAQAWLIARDAGIIDLLTGISHYEGHPPVWSLLLMPAAKLGVPFEIGVKSLNFIIIFTAMSLFIFKSPFSRYIRCLVPFTYFFFYQYGVVSRPYSLMVLGFFLSAMTYAGRNKKPVPFVLSLMVLCGSSAYGILFAAGICLVWLAEILRQADSIKDRLKDDIGGRVQDRLKDDIGGRVQDGLKDDIGGSIKDGLNTRLKVLLKLLLKDRRLAALAVLLLFNLLLVLCIYPVGGTYGTSKLTFGTYVMRLLYILMIAPADSTFTQVYNYGPVRFQIDTAGEISIITSYFIIIGLFIFAKKARKLSLFLLPYALFSFGGAAVYLWTHHTGIVAVFFTFFLWCCLEERTVEFGIPAEIMRFVRRDRDVKYLKVFPRMVFIILIAGSVYWSVMASVHDMSLNYGEGREAAQFIKENGLDKLKIMAAWTKNDDYLLGKTGIDLNSMQGTLTLAYFDRNIFYNYNDGRDDRCYLLHRVEYNDAKVLEYAKRGLPDVIYGKEDLKAIFGKWISIKDYALVKVVKGNFIWKDELYPTRQFIFLRRDLLKEYPDLEVLDYRGAINENVSLMN